MKIASKMVTDAETGRKPCEILIQTELGIHSILDKDISTDEVKTCRVTAKEALEIQEFSNCSTAPAGSSS